MNEQLPYSNQVLTIATTRRQYAAAISATLLLLLISAAALPFGDLSLSVVKPFLPAFIAWFLFGDLLTAHLLYSQYRAIGNLSILILACTYLFTALIMIPYILTYPGVFTEKGMLSAGSQTSSWLWVCWHAGFPAGIISYLLADRWEKRPVEFSRNALWAFMLTCGILILVAAAAVVTTSAHDSLPVLVEQDKFNHLTNAVIKPLMLGLNFVALVMLVGMKKGKTVLSLWLSVALLAFLMDIVVSLPAGSRYTFGWYMSRFNSLVSAFVLICAIIYEVNRLYVRLVKQQKDLVESREELRAMNEQLTQLTNLDGLTGISNRRRFDELLEGMLEESSLKGHPFSLLLLDIDFFKLYNDRYGHQKGDLVLKKVAQLIDGCLQDGKGVAARYGGEEFAVLLPYADRAGALGMAHAILEAIQAADIPHETSLAAPRVTASIGSSTNQRGEAWSREEMISRADRALYKSKAAGRNRAAAAEEE
ncbi:GGDEF domain-containing protein [Paenibacillus sp. P22]|uniref:sensor domain-containing diguanylate cyclase n=1 Tax=Paenibacillus TaxID=44249 RepID=UPI0004324566|nr:GGDEF domain-containing protein [Paenibacillus sp. P22]CDN45957.1 Diguanylate cyclase [Paenibacillus sp. P22]